MNPSALAFQRCVADTRAALATVEGWLSDREMQFLVTLAAYPTCEGDILELGSYRGKSTIALAKGAALADQAIIHSIDPLPPATLHANLSAASVRDQVVTYHALSTERTGGWSIPLRLLWHDGANDLATVADDLENLLPRLADGAVVAFHDVLNTSGMRIFAFTDAVLASPHFGAAGVCGSIGWAQYRQRADDAAPHRLAKLRLYRKLIRLQPFHRTSRQGKAGKLLYKLFRSQVPHGAVSPDAWRPLVA